jgi:hypothetical protein
MAKLGSIFVAVRAKTDKYKRDLANAKTMTEKASVMMKHQISSISFAQVGVAALAFGAIMTKVGLDGFRAMEKLKLSTASMASTITSFAKNAERDLTGTYKQALDYSGQLVLKMEELNAQTVATGENLTVMVETMAQNGVLLDLNNEKQIKGFLAIANALALITQGQNQDIQFRQEIRGLMQGEVRATNMLSRLLSQRVGGELKKHVEIWKEKGTLIENAGALLSGFQEGAKDLSNTWLAVGTTIETMYNRVLRGMIAPIYEDIIKMGKQITMNALDQDSLLNRQAETLKTTIYRGWQDIKNITQSIVDVIAAFKTPLILIGKILGMILDGWGQIFAILQAVTRSFKLITQAVFDSVKMIGHFGAALWKATSLNFKGAAESIALAKEDWIESGKKTGEAFGSGFIDQLSKNLIQYNKNLTTLPPVKVKPPNLESPKKKDEEFKQDPLFQSRIAGIKEEERLRAEKWQAEIELSNAQIEKEKELYEQKLETQKEFNLSYEEIGLDRFELERLQVERMTEIYEKAGVNRTKISELTSDKLKKIAQAEQQAKLTIYQGVAGGIADTFQMIAQAGGKHSKEAFKMYKAFAMAQALIAGAQAVLAGLAAPWPLNMIMPIVAGAAAAVKIASIANQQPPSYDQGGISQPGEIYQTGPIRELHIPMSGKSAVDIGGGQKSVQIIMNNPTFQDLETQKQTMAQISEVVTRQIAPGAIIENYQNDGAIRSMVKGGM